MNRFNKVFVRSLKVAASLSKGLVSTSPIAENFLSPSSSTAFMKACRLSKVVSSFAFLPSDVAYFSVASSKRTIIPNSSSNSGSNLIAPFVRRLRESAVSLPRAILAFLATSPNLWILEESKPALVASAVARIASSKFNACPVASRKSLDIVFRAVPEALPMAVRPASSCCT